MPYQLKFIFDFGFPILDFTSPVPHTFQRSHRYLHLGESAFSFANAVRNWSSLLTNPELPSSVQAAPVRKILRTPNSVESFPAHTVSVHSAEPKCLKRSVGSISGTFNLYPEASNNRAISDLTGSGNCRRILRCLRFTGANVT